MRVDILEIGHIRPTSAGRKHQPVRRPCSCAFPSGFRVNLKGPYAKKNF